MGTRAKAQPVLIGAAQHTDRQSLLSASQALAKVCRCAAEDAGIVDLLARLDSVTVINVLSDPPASDPRRLASTLSCNPTDLASTSIGATAPIVTLARLCSRISSGNSSIGIICAAEAFGTAEFPREILSLPTVEGIERVGDARSPVTPLEMRYGLVAPLTMFGLIANAYRAQCGLSLDEYLAASATLGASMSQVAAQEPYAWFRQARSGEEIRTAHPRNRMAVHPYTKLMCAMMGVRQAAALLVVDESVADRFGVPQDRRVYLTTASEGYNPWFVSEREHLATSMGLERALERAWGSSGLSPDAVDLWDLYSCFPVATQLASDVLGRPDDSPVTLIGGLPYFGGPGNHYSLHALCHAVQRLRAERDKTAMIEALSWYMSKFAVAVLSAARPAAPFAFRGADPREAEGQCAVCEKADGRREIESYTVLFDREQRPLRALIVARDADRRRCLAVNDSDAALIEAMTRTDPIGGTANVAYRSHDGLNHILDID